MRLFRIAFMLMIALLVAACGINVNRNQDGSLDVSITLSEQQVNDILTKSVFTVNDSGSGQSFRVQNATVDLQPGGMVVSGEVQNANGGGTVPGTVTFSVSAEGGKLNVRVTNVNAQGWAADDQRIAALNEQIASALGQSANQSGDFSFQSIAITDTNMTMVIRTKPQ
jgi:hypothetical protein